MGYVLMGETSALKDDLCAKTFREPLSVSPRSTKTRRNAF